MTINRINYEQFALDYLEGSLPADLLVEMESFLDEHPDIRKELEEMEMFYLEPETDVVFDDKDSLLAIAETTPKKRRILPFLLVACGIALLVVSAVWLMVDTEVNQEGDYAGDENHIELNAPIENEIKTPEKQEDKEVDIEINDSNSKQQKPENQIYAKTEKPVEEVKETPKPKVISTPEIKAENMVPVQEYAKEEIKQQPKEVIAPKTFELPENEPEFQAPIAKEEGSQKQEEKIELVPTFVPVEIIGIQSVDAVAVLGNSQGDLLETEGVSVKELEPRSTITSRLSKMGLVPKDRDLDNIKSGIKDALTPEAFATSDW